MLDIIQAIDEEIARLTDARALIAGSTENGHVKRRGRPAGKGMSPAARKRMAARMRERWAKAKSAGKKGL